MNRIVPAVLMLVGLAVANLPSRAEETCTFAEGEARWPIKTSVPAGALDTSPNPVDLDALIGLKNPPLTKNQTATLQNKRWSGAIRISSGTGTFHEGDIITVTGFLYRVRCQRDGDFHLEIGISNDRENVACLIVEIPDPKQIQDPKLKAQIDTVRQHLQRVPASIFGSHPTDPPVRVQITGQLFLDATHIGHGAPGGGRGTNGCATNVWELHPVTALVVQ